MTRPVTFRVVGTESGGRVVVRFARDGVVGPIDSTPLLGEQPRVGIVPLSRDAEGRLSVSERAAPPVTVPMTVKVEP